MGELAVEEQGDALRRIPVRGGGGSVDDEAAREAAGPWCVLSMKGIDVGGGMSAVVIAAGVAAGLLLVVVVVVLDSVAILAVVQVRMLVVVCCCFFMLSCTTGTMMARGKGRVNEALD